MFDRFFEPYDSTDDGSQKLMVNGFARYTFKSWLMLELLMTVQGLLMIDQRCYPVRICGK